MGKPIGLKAARLCEEGALPVVTREPVDRDIQEQATKRVTSTIATSTATTARRGTNRPVVSEYNDFTDKNDSPK